MSDRLFKTMLEIQSSDLSSSASSSSKEDKVKCALEELINKLPEKFTLQDLSSDSNKTPFMVVALQECERMNMLLAAMEHSLKLLDLGLKVK